MAEPDRTMPLSSSLQRHRTVVVSGINVAAVLLINIIVARYWGAARRGELAVAATMANIFASLGGLGAAEVIVWATGQGIARQRSSEWARASLVTVLVASVAAWIATATLLHFAWWLCAAVAVGVVVAHALRVRTNALLAMNKLAWRDAAMAAPLFAGLSLSAAAAMLRSGIHPVYVLLAGQLIAVALLARPSGLRFVGRLSWPNRQALRLGAVSSLGGLVQTSLARIDVLIVTVILGASAAGIYAVALAAGEGVLVAATGLAIHAFRDAARGRSDATLIVTAVIWTAALSVVGAGLVNRLAGPILGAPFAGLDHTFFLLIPGILATAVYRIRWAASVGWGSPVVVALCGLVGVIVQTVLDFALVGRYGIVGAAVASSLAAIVAAIGAFVIPIDRGRRDQVMPETSILQPG
jgi:O-antigen/teichoic acid export membrane protein